MTNFFQYPRKFIGARLNQLVLLGCVSIVTACGGGGPAGNTPPPRDPVLLYSKVMDMRGAGLVLQNNNADDLTVNTNGLHNFNTPVLPGESYHVTVVPGTNPQGEVCTPRSGPGIVGATAPVVDVQCSTIESAIQIGGIVKDLKGGTLQLQNNGAELLNITANGQFKFKDKIAAGGRYSVLVTQQPTEPAQKCTVKDGTDSGKNSDVTNIVVQCSLIDKTHFIGGKVKGLEAGNQVTLINNDDSNQDKRLVVTGTGSDVEFKFADKVADKGSYRVAVFADPATQSCDVKSGGQGDNVQADVNTVEVVCSEKLYYVKGAVEGLTEGKSVTLINSDQNEVKDSLTVTGDATNNIAFAFANRMPKGSNSYITVSAQPTGLGCTVSNPEHLNLSSDINDIKVICSDKVHNLGYKVSGLLTNQVAAINNDDYSDINVVTQNDVLNNFKTKLADGGSYNFRITKMPFLQHCAVPDNSGSGKNVKADVSVAVKCEPPKYTQLHLFDTDSNTGASPRAALIEDSVGNLYGTASSGMGPTMRGTVYKIAANGTYTVLHSFNMPDLNTPLAALVLSGDGYLYGTASAGGPADAGGVFRIKTDGTAMEVLHYFNGADGKTPRAGLIEDNSNPGTFYGTTDLGGANNKGTIFSIANNQFKSLFSFTADGVEYGSRPRAALLQVGNVFYGTAWAGGENDVFNGGAGTIYSFTVGDNEIAMKREYSFKTLGTEEGSSPLASLVKSNVDGKLYGTTDQGAIDTSGATVFSFDPQTGTLKTLHTFDYMNSSGDSSYGGVVQGLDGAFYGMTRFGTNGPSIFRITPDKQFTVLLTMSAIAFPNDFPSNPGPQPQAGLMMSKDGNLYGTITRAASGFNSGAVFRFGKSQ